MKTHFQFEAVCGPKFMSFGDDVGDPSQLSTHLPGCLCHVSFGGYRPLKLQLSCEVVQKGGFGPDLSGDGIPQISDMHFQITLTSDHVAKLSSVHRAPRVADKKEERKKESMKETRKPGKI